ncbi:MAG TPA: fibronectin type III domain-containing protein [Gemmatimonadaceae bacterium]|nr:fibronectin type III domain-containing protein [Gemmatimonadaceae bacterium]
MRTLVCTVLLVLTPSLAVAQTRIAQPSGATLLVAAPPGGPAPTGIRAGATPTSITIKWTCPSGPTGYEVFAMPTGGGQSIKLTATPIAPQCIQDFQGTQAPVLNPGVPGAYQPTSQTSYVSSYTHTGLRPGMQFDYVVRALYPQGVGDAAPFTAQTAPWPAPTGVTPTLAGRSVSLSWNAVEGATGYIVLRQLAGENALSPITPSPITVTSYSDATILAPGDHRYSVRAVDGTPAAAVSVNVGNWPAPTFTSVALTGRRITLHWSQIPGVSGYVVYRKSLAETSFRPVATYAASQYWYVEENLPVGPHTFYVQASGAADPSASTSVISGKPHRAGARIFRGSSVIDIGWDGTDLSPNTRIFRAVGPNAVWADITHSTYINGMVARYRNASVGVTEYYKVAAFYPTVTYESDPIAVTVPVGPVGATNLQYESPANTDRFVSKGQASVWITWTCDPEATHYLIMRGPKGGTLEWIKDSRNFPLKIYGCAALDIFWPGNIPEWTYKIVGEYPDEDTSSEALITVTAKGP